MNFSHLRNAAMVADCGSINKAAAELFVSQPCLSNSIKLLEKELGFPIFQRSKTGVVPTPKGEEFLEIARDILKDYERLEALSEHQNRRPLSIAGYPLSYLAASLLRFQKNEDQKFPDKHIECGNLRTLDTVASGAARIGFVFFACTEQPRLLEHAEKRGLKCEKLFSPIRMYAVAGRSHPIAKYEKISFEELVRHPLVAFSDHSTLIFLKKLGYQFHPSSLYVPDRRMLFDAIRSGEYASMMTVTKRSLSQDLVYLPIKDERFSMSIFCVMPKIYRMDAREKAFLKFLKQDVKFLQTTDEKMPPES